MLSALKEFKMCGIRPEDLKAAADRLAALIPGLAES